MIDTCCEWCGETSPKKRRRRIRGELVCKECKDAWDEQPKDGGFW